MMADSPRKSEQSTTKSIPEKESPVNPHKNANRQSLRDRLEDTRVLRPLVTLLGPIPVMCFIWIFFAFTFVRPVVLPDSIAPVVQDHSQSTTMIASMIATAIAIYVSFFFSLAMRFVIAVRLAIGPTPLDRLTPMTSIANKALWFHPGHIRWTIVVIIVFLGVSLQTSALTSLLSVHDVQISHVVTGKDINLADPGLLQGLGSDFQLPTSYDQLASYFLQNAMVDSLQFKRNTTTFNFNGYIYLTTTGGIHPATYEPIHNEQLTTNLTAVVPPNLNFPNPRQNTVNRTMELTQQGFTADVNCRQNAPNDTSQYNPQLNTQPITTDGVSSVNLTINCSTGTITEGPVIFNTSDTTNSGGLLSVACEIPGTNNFDLIIVGTGGYNFIGATTCTVTPMTTVVDVRYSSSQDPNALTTITVSTPTSESGVPFGGRVAIDMLLFNVMLGQSIHGNTVANAWFSGLGNATLSTSFPDAMDNFVRAAVEFSGTVLRQVLTVPPTASPFPIDGTITEFTPGWHQDDRNSPLLMLPTMVTIIITYGLVIYGLITARKHKDKLHKDDLEFDPSNIVHVIAAHTPHKRQSMFKTFGEQSKEYMQSTSVEMRSGQGGVRAFHIS